MPEQTGKIPILAIKTVTGLSYVVAISIALARIVVRLHINKSLHISKRLYLDDWLLLFACSCLTAATILLLYATDTVYLIEATSLNPIGLFGGGGSGITDLDTLLRKINFFARFNWIYLILSWTTIFAVKFGFLSFFRNMVLRLPSIHRYWRVVVAVTAIVYVFSLIDGVIACPHDGLRALSCSVNYAREIGAIAIGLDILTDLMILAIPVNILWRVKMQTQQKLGLAAFLCLQVLMIIIAVIRISGFIYRHAFDEGWVYLWQQIESCVSVSTISLTAFRIMFVAGTSRREQSPRQWSSRGAWRRRFLFKKNSGVSTSTGGLDDVTIPSARLSGMRTVIGGPRTQMFSILDEDVEEWPLRPLPARVVPGRDGSEGGGELARTTFPHNFTFDKIGTPPPGGADLRVDSLYNITSATNTPDGLRNIYAGLIFKATTLVLAQVNRTIQSVYQTSYDEPPYDFLLAEYQPIPYRATVQSIKNGGDVFGLDKYRNDNIIQVMLVALWTDPTQDTAVRELIDATMSDGTAYAQNAGTYRPGEYVNYAHESEDPIGSYGADNVQFLKNVSLKYDGESNSSGTGGFKT